MNKFSLTLMVIMLVVTCTTYASDTDISAIEGVYQSAPDLSADFTQKTYVALIQKTVLKKGKFYFKKGGMLRIEYKGNEEKHYVSDGTTFWVYTPGDAASMQTYEVSEETVPKEALAFLSGFGRLKKEFKIEKSSAFEDVPVGFVSLHLKPVSKKAQYKSLDALFNEKHLLAKLKVMNLSGNITDYEFTNIKTGVGLGDDFFVPQ